MRNSGTVTAADVDPFIEEAYQGVLDKYPDSESAAPAALNLARMNSEKGLLHDAAKYYETYLKKESDQEKLTKALARVYSLGRDAERQERLAVAAELYGLVVVFTNPDDPLREKARASAVRSLEVSAD